MVRTVLITGGSGFLGRRLGALLRDDFDVVLAARNNEQNALASAEVGCRAMPLDVTNVESVRDVLLEVRPDVVVHAAATKYVDLSERFPMECVDVNVLGSQNVARAAMDRGVPLVVGVSTDKAAPPVPNTYGLSKALMERMLCTLDGKSGTRFVCVRFGNIAWSTGSVFPVWKRMQEEHGGLIESTGPDMRRFFFTVHDAARLVRAAMDHPDEVGGSILSLPMKAAEVRDLLEVWIEEKGGSWRQIERRPGDREDEELIGEIEVPYTREVDLGGERHYLISMHTRAEDPIPGPVTSATAGRLDRDEMARLIAEPATVAG